MGMGRESGLEFQPRSTNSFGSTPSASAIFRTVMSLGLTFWAVSSCIIVVGLTLACAPRVRCDQNFSSRNSFSFPPLNIYLMSGIVSNSAQSFHSLLILILADFLKCVKFSIAQLIRTCYTIVDIKKDPGPSLENRSPRSRPKE